MKIAIISLPLSYNYGGYLQCYALMETLRNMGHEAYFLQRENTAFPSLIKRGIDRSKFMLESVGLGSLVYEFEKKTNSGIYYKTKNFRAFTKHYIKNCSPGLRTTEQVIDFCKFHHIDAYITGPDQIWRGKYSRSVNDAFLGFAPQKSLKIAYAPSFGTDELEFNAEQTTFIEKQLNTFQAISVREESGVKLLHDNVHLIQMPKVVLDPTFLLPRHLYLQIAKQEIMRHGVLTYILNQDTQKKKMIDEFCFGQGLGQYSVINPKTNTDVVAGGQGYSVEQWLAGFREASYVMTDSFHATVFSIIFNKPFWVFENKERGNSRILNILHLFGCEDRLVHSDMHFEEMDWKRTIDWDKVNQQMEKLISCSKEFLEKALKHDRD